ncbi:Hypothetical protein FKW44_002240 [Caligus rogercresseyi]|uniref:Uncharacterized protein n=1 Tax=Caligus rogercresseyi TaxID=217165 RepID=A0A7T8QW75_CALRO|nr:Hypothetical protein FKW44_002240 [Caligus rogercresseyi]
MDPKSNLRSSCDPASIQRSHFQSFIIIANVTTPIHGQIFSVSTIFSSTLKDDKSSSAMANSTFRLTRTTTLSRVFTTSLPQICAPLRPVTQALQPKLLLRCPSQASDRASHRDTRAPVHSYPRRLSGDKFTEAKQTSWT